MHPTDTLFGELRSLLQETPSETLWGRLCDHLALWPDEPRAQLAAPYAAEHLERWPDALRREAPEGWLDDDALRPLANHANLRRMVAWDAALDQLAARPRSPAPSLDLSMNQLSPARLERLLATSCLDGAQALDLSLNHLGPAVAAMLSASPHLRALHTLDLSFNLLFGDVSHERGALHALDLPALRALKLAYNVRGAAHHVLLSPCAPQLEALDMRSASLGEDDLRALSSATALANLRALQLSDNRFGDDGVRVLLASPHLARLERLDVTPSALRAPLRRDTLYTLLDAPHMPALRDLTLDLSEDRCEPLSEADVAQLARHPGLARVSDLALGAIHPANLRALLASPHLTSLTTLHLRLEERAASSLAALDAHPLSPQLKSLHISGLRGVPQRLASLAHMTQLTTLTLQDWPSSDMHALLSSACLTHLKTLRLADDADASCLHVLSTSPHLSQLQELSLGHARLSAAQLLALLDSPHLTRLRRLDLSSCALDDAAIAALTQTPSAARLRALNLSHTLAPAAKARLATSPHLHPAIRHAYRA